jgi:serine/threonine-protein kinase SRPK3
MPKYDDRKINWTGKILNDKYVLIKKIGLGSYATVWLSYVFDKQKYVAIKINNRRDVLTAMNEVNNYKTIGKLNNEHLMKTIDIFEHENNYYDDDDEVSIDNNKHYCIVMELMGLSLYDMLKTNDYKKNIKFNNIIDVMKQVLKGLNDLHDNNIIHGDMKPENILVKNSSNKYIEIMKMLDINKLKKRKQIVEKINKHKSKLNSRLDDDTTSLSSSSSDRFTDGISVFSYFSSEYGKIKLSDNDEDNEDGDEDNDEDDGEDDDEDNDEDEDEDEDDSYDYSNLRIQIVDYGECQSHAIRKKREIQTCYYKSPEILLGLPYTTSSDMWAFGCTLIELLTQSILFDAYEYEGNTIRHHLYMINCFFGDLPKDMIINSPKKDIFYTKNLRCIKGYDKIEYENNISKIILTIKQKYNLDDVIYLTDFIKKIFDYNDKTRITAKLSLNHDLFKL